MATQKGTTGIFGIPNTTGTTLSIGGVQFTVFRTYNYNVSASTREIPGADGDTINVTSWNQIKTLTVDITVSAADAASALAIFNGTPDVLDAASLVSTDLDINSNNWLVESASKTATSDDMAVMTINLKQWSTLLA